MGLEAPFTVADSEFSLTAVFNQLSSVTIETHRQYTGLLTDLTIHSPDRFD